MFQKTCQQRAEERCAVLDGQVSGADSSDDVVGRQALDESLFEHEEGSPRYAGQADEDQRRRERP